jgi:twinkle protein
VLTVYRNKRKEAEIEAGNYASSGEPDQYIICDKQRNGDWEGRIGLWYDKASRQYVETAGEAPHDLMEVLP